tara:strand:+ start:127625 stop:127915 length:291 start_codon:yes stop_codon:yes gene_type:complete
VKYEINELYSSARHAYIAIGLAVKTSRPRNEVANLRFALSNYALIVVEGPKTSHCFFKEHIISAKAAIFFNFVPLPYIPKMYKRVSYGVTPCGKKP